MREDGLKAQDAAGSEIGSPSPSMSDFTLSRLLSSDMSAGTFRWFASRGELFCASPHFCLAGFLNVCASVASWMLRIVASAAFPFAARRIHLGRFVHRLRSLARIITTVYTHRVVPLVTKLSLRGVSKWMKTQKFIWIYSHTLHAYLIY